MYNSSNFESVFHVILKATIDDIKWKSLFFFVCTREKEDIITKQNETHDFDSVIILVNNQEMMYRRHLYYFFYT